MIHYRICQRPDEVTHRLPLASGEISVTTSCRTCGATHTRVADRDDLDDDPEGRITHRWACSPM